ncbi:MAG: ABC transporter ATP-binding protein [Nitrososphaerota archaeon]|nr:ABC transporter ATP-binding protein [Nitrososphaerota archaeon]
MSKTIRFLRYLFHYKIGLSLIIIGIALASYFRLLVPAFINVLTAAATSKGGSSTIVLYSLGIIGVTAVSGAGQYMYSYLTQYTGNKVIYDIRHDLFTAIQSKSFAFLDRNQVGDLIARATGDVEAVRRFVTQAMGQLIYTMTLLAGVSLELVTLNPRLLLPGLGLMPLVIITGYLFDRQQSPNWKAVRDGYAEMNTVLEENLSGVRVVRAFTREDYEIKKFDEINTKYYFVNIDVAKVRALFIPMMPFLVGLNIAILFYLGGQDVMSGAVSIGELVEAYSILVIITPNARFLGLTLSQALNAAWGLERIFATMDAASDIQDSPDAIDLKDVREGIVFENVSFAYGGPGKTLLKNLNVTIRQGETIAIVGRTGSGKTTFVNLIPRFYDVSSGKIMIDDIDIRNVKLQSLRKLIGMVSQETFLFTRSIKDNIAFGTRNASQDDIVTCAKVARADEFIRSFPKGYDTVVGEKGSTLSGGQKQRVAIARALLVNPKILIFDESTSSVDVETERDIQDAMKKMLANRTTLLITQRLSTVRLADRIFVFDAGELVEVGTHEELVRKKNGVYADIFAAQFMTNEQTIRSQ